MKTNLLILFCCLAWSVGFAQNQNRLDSLKQALAGIVSDSSRIELFDRLRLEYLEYKNDSALYYCEQAIAIAERNNLKLKTARLLGVKAYTLMLLGRYSASFLAYRRAFELAENPANETKEWVTDSPHKDRLNILAFLHQNFGHLMSRTGNTDKQIAHYREAEKLAKETGDTSLLGLIYMNLGPVYLHKFDEPDTALQMEQKALKLFTQTGQKKWLGVVFLNLGHVYSRKKENSLAVEHFYKAVQAGREVNNFRIVFSGYSDLADFYMNGQNRDSSLFYAREMGDLVRLQSAALPENAAGQYYAALSKSYSLNNQTDSAYKYLNLAFALKDSSYQFRIKNLTDVQNLSFGELLRAEHLEQEKAALQNRIRQYALLGGLAVVLLVAFMLYRNNRQKQKTNARLEAQNRELEIEAALERVRSRTMAMHKTDELRSVIHTVFEQFKSLGFDATACGLTLFNKEDKSMTLWLAGFDTDAYPESYFVPYFDHPLYNAQFEAWEKGQIYQVFKFKGELKKSYDELIFELGDFKNLPSSATEAILSIETATNCSAFMKYGMLESVMIGDEVLTEQQTVTLQRFAKVFEQTYTRFLDLQKAEAQAREALMEAALERVRASMMAMHRSDELRQVIGTMFSQLQSLGFDAPGSALIIYDKDGAAEHWMTGFSHDTYPQSYKIPYNEHPYFLELFQAWQDNLPYEEFPFEGPAKIEYTEWCLENSEFKNLPDEFKQEMKNPARIIMADAFNKYGMVEIMTLEPLNPVKISILKRFSKVFEQTYTRFLDLQKAEAQAQEAQIEAALERVRSRAIAMRHSDELSEAAELLYQEFLKMGVESFSCGYLINDDEKGEWKIWLTNPGEAFFKEFWTCPYFADHNLRARYESWKRKDEFHYAVLEGEENRAHHVVISKYAPWKEAMLASLPPRLVFNSAHFSLGHLLVISPDRLAPELEQAMARFAKVFDLTWRRFLDLQKAEAQAREARIDAGLDRLRAEIASMRATEDLERITPLVWRELTSLEVPFFRCGVFIMDEAKELVHTYLSTPDGKSLSVLHLPFDGAETTRKTVEHWRKQEVYLDNWDKQQFTAWVQSLTGQGYIKESKAYQGAERPPEALALHFVPFKQGMLYVGNSEKLPEEQIDLVQRLADTFAVAYSRYEDFTRLEDAKRKVETTLTDLKSTQTQLIQSEKLASLGELTAGIAHEIQNPLNFVNNFSELSVDLAKEINEEMDKEPIDTAFVKELMSDLTQNQEKINLHGKRAAAIVSGMLQHARSSTGTKEPTDLNALADEYLRLSYHGLRAKDPNFNATMVTDFDPTVGKVEVIPQDMGRVLLNLINNAFYAVQQRKRAEVAARDLPGFQNLEGLYAPTVTVSTQKTGNQIIIKIKDNGTGIPDDVKAKIFQPFFTTKPTGQGTGLGLSLAYDIVVKGHGGTLEVDTKEGEGTEFIIKLFVN